LAKTRVPRLPAGANRAAYQAYVKEVRRYAQSEFPRGASEGEIYERVNPEGVALPALRSVIGREYLTYIGVTGANVKGVRFFAMISAFVFYAVATSQALNAPPIYRYGLPALASVAVFFGVENLGLRLLRMRKKPKP
jgi:hypothetical protein